MLKHISYYKPSYEEKCASILKAYDDANEGVGGNVHFLISTMDLSLSAIDLSTFGGFEEKSDIDRFLDLSIENIEKQWESIKEIDDSTIPSLAFNMGIGEYAAFVDGEISFTSDTSWCQHTLEEPEDFKNLPPLGTSKWYQRYLYMFEEFLKKTAHTEAPVVRSFFSPLDLANALLGDKLYMDFYDKPEEVHELMNYCADAIIKFAEDLYSIAGKYVGDTKYGMMYLDGYINMSEDIATLISADMYQEFCAEHTQKVIDHFGRGLMHTHTRALYQVKEICGLRNACHMWLATDPNQTRAIDVVPKLIEDSNKSFMAIDCETVEEIRNTYTNLIQGNFSVWMPASSITEANQILDEIKKIIASY